MAIRGDITINWETSPRIITVESPSTEVDMQSLYDTLRWLEASSSSMDNHPIVSGSGKEELGAGTRVGLTISLLDAKVAFEARPGPDWVLCSLDGGNLVSLDLNGESQDTRHPTAFTTVDRTSSASATLTDQDALQYSSYNGYVSVRVGSGISGIEYPAGNAENPVDNISDAVIIAYLKGFDTLFLIGEHTLTSGDNVTGLKLKGQNAILTKLNVLDLSYTADCQIEDVQLNGILDGNTVIERSAIHGLQYVSGIIHKCTFGVEPIVLGNSEQAMFIDCSSSVSGDLTPIIDMGGSGQSLAVRGYAGGIKLINRTGEDPVSIDMNSGHVIIDSTCTAGKITLRGIFKLTDNSGAGCTVDTVGRVLMESEIPKITEELLSTDVTLFTEADTIGEALFRSRFLKRSIYINTEELQDGDGSQSSPFNNINSAKDYAEQQNIKNIVLYGSVQVPSPVKGMLIHGIGLPEIDFNNQDIKDSKFYNASLKGAYSSNMIAEECQLQDGLGLDGYYNLCELQGTHVARGGANISLVGCISSSATISLDSGLATTLNVKNHSGDLTLTNSDHQEDVTVIELNQGRITIDSSCVLGTLVLTGIGTLVDNSNGTVVYNELLSTEAISTDILLTEIPLIQGV